MDLSGERRIEEEEREVIHEYGGLFAIIAVARNPSAIVVSYKNCNFLPRPMTLRFKSRYL
jgi:hypothetical protein